MLSHAKISTVVKLWLGLLIFAFLTGCRGEKSPPVSSGRNDKKIERNDNPQSAEKPSLENEKKTYVIVKTAGSEKNNWFEIEWYEPWRKVTMDRTELALKNPDNLATFVIWIEWRDDIKGSDLLAYTQDLPSKLKAQDPAVEIKDASYAMVGGKDVYRIFFSSAISGQKYEMDQTIVMFDGGVLHCTARALNGFTVEDRALLDAMLKSLKVLL